MSAHTFHTNQPADIGAAACLRFADCICQPRLMARGTRMETAEVRLSRLLAEHFGLQPGQIQPSHSFTGDLGFDSLDGVEAVMLMEDNFGFQTTDVEAFAVLTVQALIDLVKSKVTQ